MLSKIEQQKLQVALELKFLLSQHDPSPDVLTRIKDIINTFEPFVSCPLTEAPPAYLYDCTEPTILQTDLREEAANYTFVVLAGQVHVKSKLAQNYRLPFRSYIDLEVLDGLSGNYISCDLVAYSNSFVLKINQMWRDAAKLQRRQAKINYCRSKLKQIDFFLGLTYGDFNRLCENCTVLEIPANNLLIEAGKVPKHLYCLVEGIILVERTVQFRLDPDLSEVFMEEAVKNKPNLEQYVYELIQYPTEGELQHGKVVSRNFMLEALQPGTIICGRETLGEIAMCEDLRAEVKSKVLAISYSDLFNIDKEKMREIKTIETPYETSAREIRRMYYSAEPWVKYKQFLLNENKFSTQTKDFDFNRQLRGPLNLNTRKYEFIADPSMFMQTQTISKEELTSNPIRKIEVIQRAINRKPDTKRT